MSRLLTSHALLSSSVPPLLTSFRIKHMALTMNIWILLLLISFVSKTQAYNWKQYCEVSFYSAGQECGSDEQGEQQAASRQILGDFTYMCGSDAGCSSGIVECCVDADIIKPGELGSLRVPRDASYAHFECHVGISHPLCETYESVASSREWLLKVVLPITVGVFVCLSFLVFELKLRRARAINDASDGDTVKTCDDDDASIKDDEGDTSVSTAFAESRHSIATFWDDADEHAAELGDNV